MVKDWRKKTTGRKKVEKIVFVDFEHEDYIFWFLNHARIVVRLKTPQIKKKSVQKRVPSKKLWPFQFQPAATFPFQHPGKILVAILGGEWCLSSKKKNFPHSPVKDGQPHTTPPMARQRMGDVWEAG